MENTQRGAFAEFLVAHVLGRTGDIRVGWDGYDVKYRGNKIEVKTSAYLQSWPLRQNSKVLFGFQRRRQWDPVTGKMSEPCRIADIYVFAHYTEKDADIANVLDVSRWDFYVAPTHALVERFGENAGTLALAQLTQISLQPIAFSNLKDAIDEAIGGE